MIARWVATYSLPALAAIAVGSILSAPLTRPLAVASLTWAVTPHQDHVWPGLLSTICNGVIDYAPGYEDWPGAREEAVFQRSLAAVDGRRPPDLDIRLATVLDIEDINTASMEAEALLRDYPREPAACAVALETAMRGFQLGRPETDFGMEPTPPMPPPPEPLSSRGLSQTTPGPPVAQPTPMPRARGAAEVLRIAALGERLDPDNALFTAARMAALFGMHRDEEALRTLSLAASKPRWSDYGPKITQGRWRRREAVLGWRCGLAMMNVMTILLAADGRLNKATHVAVSHAARVERSGDPARGLAIRRDALTLGSMRRAESTSHFGNIMGCLMAQIAGYSPGGQTVKLSGDGPSKNQQRWNAYLLYLQAHGYPAEAARVRQEIAAQKIVALLPAYYRDSQASRDFWKVIQLSGVSMLLLSGALALAAMALATTAALRLLKRRPCPSWALGGMILGVCFISAPIYVPNLHPVSPSDILLAETLSLIVLATGLAVLGRWWMPKFALVTCGTMIVLGAVGWWQWPILNGPWWSIVEMPFPGGQWWLLPLSVLYVEAALVIPWALALGGVLLRREKVGVGLLRRAAKLSVQMAAVLVVAYAAVILRASMLDHSIATEVAKYLPHEGRYAASTTGQQLPGPLPR